MISLALVSNGNACKRAPQQCCSVLRSHTCRSHVCTALCRIWCTAVSLSSRYTPRCVVVSSRRRSQPCKPPFAGRIPEDCLAYHYRAREGPRNVGPKKHFAFTGTRPDRPVFCQHTPGVPGAATFGPAPFRFAAAATTPAACEPPRTPPATRACGGGGERLNLLPEWLVATAIHASRCAKPAPGLRR